MVTFANLPPGASSVKVECSISIRELYFRRTGTSGPVTVLFSPGCALIRTACANATLGVRVANAQTVMIATAQQEVSLTFTRYMAISPDDFPAPHIVLSLYWSLSVASRATTG